MRNVDSKQTHSELEIDMEFTLATFNTYWLFDNEAPLQRWGAKLPDGGIEEKIDLIANEIMAIGPNGADVLALQEVEGRVVLEPLMSKLEELGSPLKYCWSSETLDPYTGQNVAVVSRFPATTSPITRLDQTVLPYYDHRNIERIGSLGKFLRVDVEISGEVLSLFVLHLKSQRGGTEETRLLRNAQARIVRDFTRPRVEQGNSRSPSFTAIVGDLNDLPRSSPLDILMGRHDASYNLESATAKLPEEEQYTYTYDGKRQQLDHILLSKFTHDRMLASGFKRVSEDVSDHDAVCVTLNLSLPAR
ncbi:MAG: endonuclease/exonuclease/phosphatase family protein [Erythrobacter sp.]